MQSHLEDRRLFSIDVWRGLAALAVVIIHIEHDAPGGWREHPFYFLSFLCDYGYVGVPLFVVISGFCIHRRAALDLQRTGRAQLNWVQFWKRRFWRLYPAYLAAIVFSLTCAACLQAPPWSLRAPFLPDLVWHLLLLHNLTRDYAAGLGNGAFWSLGMEEQLYALYFVLFLLLARYRRNSVLLGIGFLAMIWRAAFPYFSSVVIPLGFVDVGAWDMWPVSYWFHWALGATAVDAYLGNVTLQPCFKSIRLSLALMGVGIVVNENLFRRLEQTQTIRTLVGGSFSEDFQRTLAAVHFVGELVWPVAFFCLINWGLQNEGNRWFRGWVAQALAFVGRFSYSLYLTHVPVLLLLTNYFPMGSTPAEWAGRYLLYSATALAVGLLFYQCIERWFLTSPAVRLSVEPAGSCPATLPTAIGIADSPN